jgi:PKHD-type hydroxylase
MYPVSPYSGFFPKYAVMNKAFSEDEIAKIRFLEKIIKFGDGVVVGPSGENTSSEERDCKVSFLNVDDNTTWIYQRIAAHVSRVNYDKFMENVRHIAPIQYTMYKKEQHYNWHNDVIPYWSPYTRKISGILMLSDPDEYEGGDLEMVVNGNPSEPEILKLKRGEIVWFCPSFPHKVHPVTKGTRRTLVLWVEGDRDY